MHNMIMKTKYFKNEMLKTLNIKVFGEERISMLYKYPLGFFLLNDSQMARKVYDDVIQQIPDENSREFNIYYDCWLYLYAKLAGHLNANKHYLKINNNKSFLGGFSALPNDDPEIRATAISCLCAFLENDKETLIGAADFLLHMQQLNENENNFYFMCNSKGELIKSFPEKSERKYIFETKVARPLLYSFPLATIALLSAYFVTQNPSYLNSAKKYSEKILQNDFRNDYCGKSAVAMSLMYYFTRDLQYFNLLQKLVEYINTTYTDNEQHIHNGKILTADRLSEYVIGIEFCKSSSRKCLPSKIVKFLNKNINNNF